MSNAAPMDALGPVVLTELYKEIKDNRNVNEEFKQLLSSHVTRYTRCHIDDFFNAIKCADGLIIAFYRKYSKLKPNAFIRTELLNIDQRIGKEAVRNGFRDFLLWNQGILVQSSTGSASQTPAAIQPSKFTIHSDGRITTTVTSGPLVAKASSKTASSERTPPQALPKAAALDHVVANGPKPSTVVAKILPRELWKNASLPVRHTLSGPDPLEMIASSGSGTDTPNVDQKKKRHKGNQSRSGSRSGSDLNGSPFKGSEAERMVIDLLLGNDEDNDLQTGIGSFDASIFGLNGHSSASSHAPPLASQPLIPGFSPVTKTAATASAPTYRTAVASGTSKAKSSRKKPAEIAAAASMPQRLQQISSMQQPLQQNPSMQQPLQQNPSMQQPLQQNPSMPQPLQQNPQVNQQHPEGDWYSQQAAHIHRTYPAVDLAYCIKTLKECNGVMSIAMQRVQQYAVDLEEARLMDQARLVSETTAQTDKQRAQHERERLLASPKALEEFRDSEMMKLTSVVRTFLSRDQSALTTDGVTLRKRIVEFLEEEKKAVKWYKESARAYVRHIYTRFPATGSPTGFFEQELKEMRRIMYETASESGTPLAFLAALDAETTGGRIRPGQVLGMSADAAIELA